MSATIYQWKPKSFLDKIDAQAAGEFVEALREQHGGQITPAEILTAARSANAPIHGAFEWDDGAAAEAHRLQQAGHLLRSLVVVVEMGRALEPTPVRAFVNVTRRQERGYTSIAHAMSDTELRAQIVARAWEELMQWRERYLEYKELARVCSAIDAEAKKRTGK